MRGDAPPVGQPPAGEPALAAARPRLPARPGAARLDTHAAQRGTADGAAGEHSTAQLSWVHGGLAGVLLVLQVWADEMQVVAFAWHM